MLWFLNTSGFSKDGHLGIWCRVLEKSFAILGGLLHSCFHLCYAIGDEDKNYVVADTGSD